MKPFLPYQKKGKPIEVNNTSKKISDNNFVQNLPNLSSKSSAKERMLEWLDSGCLNARNSSKVRDKLEGSFLAASAHSAFSLNSASAIYVTIEEIKSNIPGYLFIYLFFSIP